jgi:hypothetical protein
VTKICEARNSHRILEGKPLGKFELGIFISLWLDKFMELAV